MAHEALKAQLAEQRSSVETAKERVSQARRVLYDQERKLEALEARVAALDVGDDA